MSEYVKVKRQDYENLLKLANQTTLMSPLARDTLRLWLLLEMSEISEDATCSSWECGNEFRIWKAARDTTKPYEYFNAVVSTEQLERIRDIAFLIGEWLMWKEPDGIVPISIEDWIVEFDKWEEKCSN